MGRDTVAFCPGHISGYFKPEPTAGGLPGSVGGGIVTDRGVTASARESNETVVSCVYTDTKGNVKEIVEGSPPVEYALKKAGISAEITTRTDLPPESGFGLSGAAIISSLAAGADATGISLSDVGIFRTAYSAETHFRTGLGDVPACMGGGYECRMKSGIDGEIIRRYDMKEPVYVLNKGPLPTGAVLADSSTIERVKSAYTARCPEDPLEFFRISRDFAERSGLITGDVRAILDSCDRENIPATMTMLGVGVFAYGREALGVMSEFGIPEEVHMSEKGFVRGGILQ